MDEAKPWYLSRTIWGVVVMMVASLAHIFHYEIDQQLQTDITNYIASIGDVVGGGLTIYGRIKASKAITVKAVKADQVNGKSLSSIAVLALLTMSLSACTNPALQNIAPPQPKTPQQAVYLAMGDYHQLIALAIEYNSRPRCGDGAPKICSDTAIIEQLRKANRTAQAALFAAEDTVFNPKFSGSVLDAAALSAVNAVTVYREAMKQYGVR